MQIAADKRARSLAFPGISTGIYGYPVALAAQVAVSTVRAAALEFTTVREVVFCCFSEHDLLVYRGLLGGKESR
jgi:O-acetyl-ADP-ribose deacetylase (regulator of RNase III)